jgi:ABC-type antimicrobial peptide transport system permease subunit
MAQDVGLSVSSAIATATPLLALVIVAAWIPAKRAARISPILSLKGESS